MQGKSFVRWTALTGLLLALFAIDLSFGSVQIPLPEILKILVFNKSQQAVWSEIIWNFRMTKALTCILAGSALAVAGLQMQTLFRNALAGPDVLGLTSGASLAVSLVFMSNAAGVHFFPMQSAWTIAITASIGCASVLFVMLAVARKLMDSVSLLIVGLMVGAGTSSIVSVLQYLSQAEEVQVYILWTFGSLGSLNWVEIQVLSVVLVIGICIAFLSIKPLNAWLLGDNYALSLGIDIKRSRVLIILSASILTGAVTAFCGPIAFVGLAVPHLTKLLVRSNDHKILLPAVALGGATLVLFCDILTQLPSDNYILPINAITAFIGAPVVIWVIVRNKYMRIQ